MQQVGTGFDAIDQALGGLITGDNVVWLGDDPVVYSALCAGFVRTARADDERVLHVRFTVDDEHPPVPGVATLDAGPHGSLAHPSLLADELDRRFRSERPDCIVIDDLGTPLRRWGLANTVEFFARSCPSMLQAGITAYWSVGPEFGGPSIETIRQIPSVSSTSAVAASACSRPKDARVATTARHSRSTSHSARSPCRRHPRVAVSPGDSQHSATTSA